MEASRFAPAHLSLPRGVPHEPVGLAHVAEESVRRPRPRAEAHPVGTGLGLAVVRGLTEAMKGRVEVDSRSGEGTSFAVWLPRSLSTKAHTTSLRRGAAGWSELATIPCGGPNGLT